MTDSLFSVENKVVHICGGSRGIGRAIAQAFHERGAKVVVSARKEGDLKATGLPYEVCDIARSADIVQCVDSIARKFGRIDVLFNVAGINFRHAAETYPDDKLEDVLNVNVRGNFVMARECGRRMIEQKSGKVINVGSLHTGYSLAGMVPYGASKGAIGSMTRALAVEWAAYNIQVNAIAPGFILTDLNRAVLEKPEIKAFAETRALLGRIGEPRDLVGVSIFLASTASDYMTGQVVYVDGGLTAGTTWPLSYPK
jgi:NAD(P)-dependent dehydrogenase (short-subunit alcohol dehydrogenase family)